MAEQGSGKGDTPGRSRYVIELQSLPNIPDEIVRLRQLLKKAGRRYGFKCVTYREVKEGEATK
jgi:hypothetical protein